MANRLNFIDENISPIFEEEKNNLELMKEDMKEHKISFFIQIYSEKNQLKKLQY